MKNILTILAKLLTIYFGVIIVVILLGNTIVTKRIVSATPQVQIKYIVQDTPLPVETAAAVETPSAKPRSTTLTPETTLIPTATPIATPVPTVHVVTLKDQVSQHATQSDCWVVINNHVYDITSYFGMHPGGNDILKKYCGKDGTSGFKTKEKSSSSDHSQNAYTTLELYRID